MSRRLLTADVVMTLDAEDRVFQPGYLLIEDDRIIQVGDLNQLSDPPGAERIHMDGRLLMPGLVNAHTHSPMVLFRGLSEGHSLLTWEGWYNTIRVWEEVMTADMVTPAVLVSCAEMIRTGTTCFADQYFHMDRIVPAVRRSGMRAALAYGIVEMGDPTSREREIATATEFLADIQEDPRLRGWVGPHAFFIDNSPEAIRMEMDLADRYGTGLHFHLATGGEEDEYCQKQYGHSAVQQMKLLGLFERPLLAAHCLTVPESDFETLAANRFTAVIAASACMRAGAGIAPLKAMRSAGINTAIGTDNVTNNNSYDLFNEMQIAAKLMSLREQEPGTIPARAILDMTTMGGARALGLQEEIGTLEVGKKADLISLDYLGVGWPPDPGQDLYTALVYAISGMQVCDVMVDGHWLLREGELISIDYQTARVDLNEAFIDLQRRGRRR